jgi:hypothetical protein
MRVMRRILVGAMVAMVGVAGPAFGGMPDEPAPGGAVHLSNPTGRVIHEQYHGAGAEFGLGLAAVGLSLVYTPVRMVYGLVGAGFGGFGGWVTGADMRTGKALWRPTVEGHYYIRPSHLDGRERFHFNGAVPAVREPETFDEPLPAAAAEEVESPEGLTTDEGVSADEML